MIVTVMLQTLRKEVTMYQLTKRGHTYIYDVNYGEDFLVSRIIVRSDVPGPEGLFLVKQEQPFGDLARVSSDSLLRTQIRNSSR